jgi:chaperone modulatory protein CbpM
VAKKARKRMPSEVLEAQPICSLEELTAACHAEASWIVELVEHGVLEPVGGTRETWRFSSLSVVRAAKAKRLERDLSLNMPGLALVLELLDEIDRLQALLPSSRHLSAEENLPD